MRALQRILNVRPDEATRVLILALGWAFTTGFSIAGKAARDAIFLSRFDRSYLPLMVVAIAFAVAGAVWVCSKLARHSKPQQILTMTGALVAASMLLFRSGIEGWLVPVFYVWIEVGIVILGLQFWLMAAQLVDSRQAKRLFGLISGGGSVAAILVGSQLKPFVKANGATGLFSLVAALALAAGVIGVFAGRLSPVPQPPPKRRKAVAPSRRFDDYLTSIATVICAAAVAGALVDYQFKIIAAREIPSESDLVGFFGMFSAAIGLSSLIFQFLLTGRILSRLGIVAGLALLPLGVSFGSAYILLSPVLAAAALAKFNDQTLRYTVHNSGIECLWLPVPSARRQQVKPWITGTLKSSAEGLSGLATFFLVKIMPLPLLSLLVLGVCAVWVWTLARLRGFYSSALEGALRSRSIDYDELALDVQDPTVVLTLERSLTSGDEAEQLFALELMQEMPLGPWEAPLRNLLQKGTPKIQRKVLEIAADDARVIPDQMVLEAIGAEPSVTETAIRAALKRGLEELPAALGGEFVNLDPGVRAAAARALNQMGVEPETHQRVLDGMLQGSEQEQVAALKELADLPALLPDAALVDFLRSGSTAVKEAALGIAATRGTVDFIPHALDCLTPRQTSIIARSALLRFPAEAVLNEVANRLGNASLPGEQRLAYVRILRHLDSDKTCALLCTQLMVDDPAVRRKVPGSLLAICRQFTPPPEVLKQVDARSIDWVHAAYLANESSRLLPRNGATALLADHFERTYLDSLSGLLSLLAVRRPTVPVETCLQIVRSGDKSRLSFVLDLLDSFLTTAERKQVVPLFESAEKRSAAGMRLFPDMPLTLDEVVERCIRSSRDWEQAIGLDYTSREERPYFCRHEWALPCSGPLSAEVMTQILRTRPSIQFQVSPSALANLPRRADSMYSTLEKTIILKSANLFSAIPAETLSQVAQMAEEVSFGADSVVHQEGAYSNALYIVASGGVIASIGTVQSGVLRRGESFGEIAALNGDTYRAGVRAAEDTVLLRIEQEDFFDLMQANTEVMRGVVGLLARRVVQVGDILRDSLK